MSLEEENTILKQVLNLCMPDLWEVEVSDLQEDQKELFEKAKEILNNENKK